MPDEIDDRATALRIACGRDDTGRLVEQYVGERLRADPRAVDLDEIAAFDERVQLATHTVDGHATCLDQLISLAP
jgi:hypothetical protein